MELITILNRCHRLRGFIYERAHFSADKKSIEVAVRPRKGSSADCSRCHLPAPGYDQLAERRFEFIPMNKALEEVRAGDLAALTLRQLHHGHKIWSVSNVSAADPSHSATGTEH